MNAKKMVEKTRKGEYEIIKNHVKKCTIDESTFIEISDKMCIFGMDAEEAYFKGICFDMDGDLVFIDVDKFTKTLNDYVETNNEDNDEIYELLDSLENFTGYTLYL